MWTEREVSRRRFLTSMAAVAAAGASVGADRPDPPLITRRVEKLYKIEGCRQPNDLQFVPDGLWVLD